MLSVDEAPEATEVGFRVAVTPLGAPETLRFTVSDDPDVTAVETVLLVLLPATTETDVGLALIEKSFVVPQLRAAGATQAFPLGAEFENSNCTV
jgi:hypothetical protein